MIDPKTKKDCCPAGSNGNVCFNVLGQVAAILLPLIPTVLLLTIGLMSGSTELILIGWAFGCVMWKMHRMERKMNKTETTDPFIGY